jgi:hydroxymethylglutaryl-CoA reductase
VASTAGVPEEFFETVVETLIESGEIKVWKAQEIAKNLSRKVIMPEAADRQSAYGKIILLGEHAVVYGRPAIALPIPLAVEAAVRKEGDGINVLIPRWGIEQKVRPSAPGFAGIIATLMSQIGLANENMTIEVFPHIPRAMGLGGSSALAVAILRAADEAYGLQLSDGRINELAFECEKTAHGTPSGIDNTVATYGAPLLYQRQQDEAQQQARFTNVTLGQPLEMVIGVTGKESLTADTVARVRASWQQYPDRYESLFDQIGQLTTIGHDALQEGRLEELGELMNLCHGYLNALQLSTPELEELVHIARRHGAIGAKLTGGGGGGSMIALCPDATNAVQKAFEAAGYKAIPITLG